MQSEAFDAGSDLGRVYDALTRHPRSSASAIAAQTGQTAESAERLLDRLTAHNLAVRLDGSPPARWEASPPDDAIEDVVEAERARLDGLRAQARRLAEVYRVVRHDTTGYPGIEVVTDHATVIARFHAMQEQARAQVRGFDRPPYVSARLTSLDEDAPYAAQSDIQHARMAAGVRYRTVYHGEIYNDPRRLAGVMAAVSLGEQARVLENLPMKLVIADETCALLPLDPARRGADATLIVHPSGLLDALIAIFDALWQLAVPFSVGQTGDPLDERDRAILTLMAAGATDEAIGRRFGLSLRTVARRTSALLERLGATTRFQAGVQAARRGWL